MPLSHTCENNLWPIKCVSVQWKLSNFCTIMKYLLTTRIHNVSEISFLIVVKLLSWWFFLYIFISLLRLSLSSLLFLSLFFHLTCDFVCFIWFVNFSGHSKLVGKRNLLILCIIHEHYFRRHSEKPIKYVSFRILNFELKH